MSEPLPCQEAHDTLSVARYFPCGQPATKAVYSQRDNRDYNMCEQHAYHAIKNRGMIDKGEPSASNPKPYSDGPSFKDPLMSQ